MANLDVLKAELVAGHPVTGAYGADDALAARQINAVNRTRTNAEPTGSELLNITDETEYNALTTDQKTLWLNLCAVEAVDTSQGVGRALEASLFGAGSTTRSRINKLRAVDISRATELGLPQIKPGHVKEARRL